jgi:hypothetical protein
MQGKSIGNAGGMADLPSIKKVVNCRLAFSLAPQALTFSRGEGGFSNLPQERANWKRRMWNGEMLDA